MSYLIAGSSKVKIALTIARVTRDRIDEIMSRPAHPTLTDVINDLLIAGLDATENLELRYPNESEKERQQADDSYKVMHELEVSEGVDTEAGESFGINRLPDM